MAKATFTVDDETLRTIRKLADRSRKPQSWIVREAVAHYAAREEKLSSDEREHLLRVLDDMIARPSQSNDTSARHVDRELQELRRARRSRGRVHPID
jgi:ribbon-helix-helix CopG family protein